MDLKKKLPSANSLFSSSNCDNKDGKKPENQVKNVPSMWNRSNNNSTYSYSNKNHQNSYKRHVNYNSKYNPKITNDLIDEECDEYQKELADFIKFKQNLKLIEYKDRLISLDTPEDIAKWREERKNNYPKVKTEEEEEEEKDEEKDEEEKDEGKKNKKKNDKEINNKKQRVDKKHQFEPQKRNLTLFEKLMVKDIERESDKIIDCFKLIVDNNFFKDK